MPALVLYQPDIAQNTGAMLRLCACLGAPLHIIEPCGYPPDPKLFKRVAMDYAEHTEIIHHTSWEKFQQVRTGRLVLLTTKASMPYTSFSYKPHDMLMVGRESAGVPEDVAAACDAAVTIPLSTGARSLNVATAAAIGLSEALRQVRG